MKELNEKSTPCLEQPQADAHPWWEKPAGAPEEKLQPNGFGKGCKTNTSYDASVSQPVIFHIGNFLPLHGSYLFTSRNIFVFYFKLCLIFALSCYIISYVLLELSRKVEDWLMRDLFNRSLEGSERLC